LVADKKKIPAIAKVSTAESPPRPESEGAPPSGVAPDRDIPPPMAMNLAAGSRVELVDDQVFADRVVIRRGEGGRILYPSSQAASWVVHFPRVGPKLRVVPEPLLRVV
jgi:hypothetical protein